MKCLERSARGTLRTPIAGSWITAPLALMELSTTKWLTSQCRIAGIRTFERAESSTRSGRVENPSWSASPIRLRSEMPDIDRAEALAQAVEVDVVTVVARNHGDAGEAAFGRLAGQHQRQPPPAREVELLEHAHDRLPTANRGSNSHSTSDRRSNTISAASSIPGCNGTVSP